MAVKGNKGKWRGIDPKIRIQETTMPEPNTGCWISMMSESTNGYVYFLLNGKRELAHRASFIIHKGTIPDNLIVCHVCDNRLCLNPDHLFLGTHRDNTMYMVKRKTINQ